jgi:hypothetical protein
MNANSVPVTLDLPSLVQQIATATAVQLAELMTADSETQPHCYQVLVDQAAEHREQVAELLDHVLPPGGGRKLVDRARQRREAAEKVSGDDLDALSRPVDGDPRDEPGGPLAGRQAGHDQPDRRGVEPRRAGRPGAHRGVGGARQPARSVSVAGRSDRQAGNLSKRSGRP